LIELADEQQQLIVMLLEDNINGRKWNPEQQQQALQKAQWGREMITRFRGRLERANL
jgi:hypothetical protein